MSVAVLECIAAATFGAAAELKTKATQKGVGPEGVNLEEEDLDWVVVERRVDQVEQVVAERRVAQAE